MDLEYLTKSQVILLALLVAIVSSAATGIVTVSLMGQAPPAVAANVGSIIERTVQQVVFATSTIPTPTPAKTAPASTASSPATAIAAVQKSIVRIVAQDDSAQKLVARGVIISADGTALTDAGSITQGTSYEALLWDGTEVPVKLTGTTASSTIQELSLVAASTTLVAAPLADVQKLALGTPVIRLGGVGATNAAEGIIAALPDSAAQLIEADVSAATPGSIIIDLSGNVIGMTTTQSLATNPDSYTLLK